MHARGHVPGAGDARGDRRRRRDALYGRGRLHWRLVLYARPATVEPSLPAAFGGHAHSRRVGGLLPGSERRLVAERSSYDLALALALALTPSLAPPSPQAPGEDERGFLQSCFSLLFGDPDPNNSPMSSIDQRRSRAISALVRANGGTVTAGQLAPPPSA